MDFLKAMRPVAVYFFELSDALINRSKGKVFCFLFNLRSKILKLNARTRFDGEYYQLLDNTNRDFKRFFLKSKSKVIWHMEKV